MAETPTRPRRTQAERTSATREALLDATIACLVEDGYARTTTARVAARAGLSRGAHLHHFQTRQALVAAAVEHLAQRRADELLRSVDDADAAAEPGPLLERLDLVWASFSSPLFQAALDLWASARTDPVLHERLVAVERAFDRATHEVAARLFPELAGRADARELVELVIATVRGLALLDTLHPGGGRSRAQWAFVRVRLAALMTDG